MGIVYQTDKRSGITYAYENQSFWDPELKRSKSKRKLIGRVDHVTKEILPKVSLRHRNFIIYFLFLFSEIFRLFYHSTRTAYPVV